MAAQAKRRRSVWRYKQSVWGSVWHNRRSILGQGSPGETLAAAMRNHLLEASRSASAIQKPPALSSRPRIHYNPVRPKRQPTCFHPSGDSCAEPLVFYLFTVSPSRGRLHMVCSWESFGGFLTEISRAAAIGRAQVELSCIPNGEVIGSLGRYRVPL